MNIKIVMLITHLLIGIVLVFPATSFADQKDTRLDALFGILQTSDNEPELQQTEASIWEIWYESGQQEIDALMEDARIAVQSSDLARAESLYSEVIEMAPEFSEAPSAVACAAPGCLVNVSEKGNPAQPTATARATATAPPDRNVYRVKCDPFACRF